MKINPKYGENHLHIAKQLRDFDKPTNWLSLRYSCILLDSDIEYPPFNPPEYFVIHVVSEYHQEAVDYVEKKFPWCDLMYIQRACLKSLSGETDGEFLNRWLEFKELQEHFAAIDAAPDEVLL